MAKLLSYSKNFIDIELELILQHVHRKVEDIQNSYLMGWSEDRKVKDAIFSMHLDKSPGPDGMNPCFYQEYNWDIVGPHVTIGFLLYKQV